MKNLLTSDGYEDNGNDVHDDDDDDDYVDDPVWTSTITSVSICTVDNYHSTFPCTF